MSLTKVTYSMIKGAVVNVLDYGVDPTGVADSYAAIQAAIDENQNSTIYFPEGTYKCSATIILTNANDHDFQGDIVGESATINFTNAGSATDTDATMQAGFRAYPKVNAVGGDNSGMNGVKIYGLTITGPAHGVSIYLSNSIQCIIEKNKITDNRYGLVTECCINTKVIYNSFEEYINAGYGMLMTQNPNVWYASASPLTSYWNDSPYICGNAFTTSWTSGYYLAHIIDYGSQAEGIRLVQNNLFYSSDIDGTSYGYVGRNCQVTMDRNWFENVTFPIRILNTNASEGGGNLANVYAAEPSGAFAISNFPDGFSYNGVFTGNYFARSYTDLNVNGVGSAYIGQNMSPSMQNGGIHIYSANTGEIVDAGDYVNGVGSYAYKSLTYNTYSPLFNDWVDYVPTVTASSGTITSYTVNSAKYLLVKQKAIQLQLDITITNNGTGANALSITLPSGFQSIANGGILNGREIASTGNQLAGLTDGTTVLVKTYNNLYPAATGYRIILSGTYASY